MENDEDAEEGAPVDNNEDEDFSKNNSEENTEAINVYVVSFVDGIKQSISCVCVCFFFF